jgi:hypothetical protein
LDAHTNATGEGAMVIPQLVAVVPDAFPRESTTCAVKLNGPATVGVPVIAPELVFRISPVGSDPEVIEKVYGGSPPLAIKEEL